MSTDGDRGAQAPVDYVNSGLRLRRMSMSYSLRVRRHFFETFMSELRPVKTSSVVDIGVTPDESLEDSNFFEQWYPYPENITATSIEDASSITDRFPGVRFVQTTGSRLPFGDNEFDFAFSSAVIEHAGDRSSQRQFLSELLRISRAFFVTTPNRWFPLELHTFLPVVHWLPQPLHQRILTAAGQRQWSTTNALNLLSRSDLAHLFPPGIDVHLGRYRFFGMTSNLIVHGDSEAYRG